MYKRLESIVNGEFQEEFTNKKDIYGRSFFLTYKNYQRKQSRKNDEEEDDIVNFFLHTVSYTPEGTNVVKKIKKYSVHNKDADFLQMNFGFLKKYVESETRSIDFGINPFKLIKKWLSRRERKIVRVFEVTQGIFSRKTPLEQTLPSGKEFEKDDSLTAKKKKIDEEEEEYDDDEGFLDEREDTCIIAIIFNSVTTPIDISCGAVVKKTNSLYIKTWDDDPQLSEFKKFLTQLNVSQCLLEENLPKHLKSKLKNIFHEAKVHLTSISKKLKKKNTMEKTEEYLKILLKPNHFKKISNSFTEEEESTFQALGIVIDYLDMVSNRNNHKFFKFDLFGPNAMSLDTNVIRSIRVLPSFEYEEDGCLYDILNECQTKMGKKRLLNWLRTPLTDKRVIDRRHDVVDAFVEDNNLLMTCRTILKKFPDLDLLSRKLQFFKTKVIDLFKFYKFGDDLFMLHAALDDYVQNSGEYKEFIKRRYSSLFKTMSDNLDCYQMMITKSLDVDKLEEEMCNKGIINPTITDKVMRLHQKMNKKMNQMLAMFEKIIKENDMVTGKAKGFTLKFSKFHIVLMCKTPEKYKHFSQLLERNRHLITVKKTKTTITLTTKEIKALAVKYEDYESRFETAEQEIIKGIIVAAGSYVPVIDNIVEEIAELDILSSFAIVSKRSGYCRPTILPDDQNMIKIVRGRHPIVEKQFEVNTVFQGHQQFIPNDITMKFDSGRFQVITGPNMGGKSVFATSIALIVIMAQIGCFVPADSADICPRDGIYTRIGAKDSLLRGVSTFMQEMNTACQIIQNSTEKSLVIIDELGRGTSANSGFGLAMAISERLLHKNKAFCLFATHFHELTILKDKHNPEIVHNKHVSYETMEDTGSIVLNYQVKTGSSSDSFGFDVAKHVGYPEEIIRVGKRKMINLEEKTKIPSKRKQNNGIEGDSKRRKLSKKKDDFDFGEKFNDTVRNVVRKFLEIPIDPYAPTSTPQNSNRGKILELQNIVKIFSKENKKNKSDLSKLLKKFKKY